LNDLKHNEGHVSTRLPYLATVALLMNGTSVLRRMCSACNTRMWAIAQRDGRPVEHRWRPLFNAAKFG